MSKFPHGGDALGAQPGHLLLAPVLRPEMVLSRQQALLDLQAIQRIPGLAGYWSADPAYLFEDSIGTIPANTNGTGVVGCAKAVNDTYVTGAEIVAAFPVPSIVNNAGSAGAWDAGTFTMSNTGSASPSYPRFAFSYGLSIGQAYEVYGVLTGSLNRFASVRLATSGTVNEVPYNPATGVFSGVTVAGAAVIQIQTSLEVGDSLTISSLSIKPVTVTTRAFQITTANKPYLRKTPTSNVHWLDSNTATSALTATLGNLGTGCCTVARAGAEGVTFTEGVTISSTYNIAPAYGFNGDVAIFNRALTASEKALLTRYMQRGVPVLSAEMLENSALNDLSGWTKLPTGSPDVTLANHAISILTSVAINVAITTAIPTNSALLFSCVFSNRSWQSLPTYIRVGSNASNVDGTDIMPTNAVKTDNTKLIFNNGSAGFIKMFTYAAVGLAFTLSSPSVRIIL